MCETGKRDLSAVKPKWSTQWGSAQKVGAEGFEPSLETV